MTGFCNFRKEYLKQQFCLYDSEKIQKNDFL